LNLPMSETLLPGSGGIIHPLQAAVIYPTELHNVLLDSPLIHWITDLADTGVVLPMAFLLIIVLWYLEHGRSAWLFARALLTCLVTMTIVKIFFLSCGHAIGSNIASPSGHTSMAFFFYGSVAVLFWARRPGLWGILIGVLTLLLVLLIGASRLVLHAHNVQEVIAGGFIGILCLIQFAWPYLHLSHPSLRLRRIALVLLPVFLLSYGTILPAENILRQITPMLSFGVCTP
jgi:membrane-associated phospholipid phosphatase